MHMYIPIDFYSTIYRFFYHPLYKHIRCETYNHEDIGQSGWITKEELLQFLALITLKPGAKVLDIGSGSGGPALFLAQHFQAHIIGIDRNEHAVALAQEAAHLLQPHLSVAFQLVDAIHTLPFQDEMFDSVLCIDACGLVHTRLLMFKEWERILRPGGYVIFTDQILTGFISSEEIIRRSSIGHFSMAAPDQNERLLQEAHLELVWKKDVTENVRNISQQWHIARHQQAIRLMELEEEIFEDIQQYLTVVHTLAHEQRLSRYVFIALKKDR